MAIIDDEAVRLEKDRNARAYGWEVGAGADMTEQIELSPDNPFALSTWRENIVADEQVG